MKIFLKAFNLKPAALVFLFPAVWLFIINGCSGHPGGYGASPAGAGADAESVEGRWGIDKDASAEYARQSPRWSDEDEASVHTVLDMLSSGYFITVNPDSIVMEARGRRTEVPVELVRSSAGEHVYRGEVHGTEVEFTVVIDANGAMNFRSSVSDDFDYLLWRRID